MPSRIWDEYWIIVSACLFVLWVFPFLSLFVWYEAKNRYGACARTIPACSWLLSLGCVSYGHRNGRQPLRRVDWEASDCMLPCYKSMHALRVELRSDTLTQELKHILSIPLRTLYRTLLDYPITADFLPFGTWTFLTTITWLPDLKSGFDAYLRLEWDTWINTTSLFKTLEIW